MDNHRKPASAMRVVPVANGFIVVPDYYGPSQPPMSEHFVFSDIAAACRHLESLVWKDGSEASNG